MAPRCRRRNCGRRFRAVQRLAREPDSGLAEQSRADPEIEQQASPRRRSPARPDRRRYADRPSAARRTAGIATPSRHATIIEIMIARKIAAATVAWPRHANTTSANHLAHTQAEQHRGLEFLPQRRHQPLPHDRAIGQALQRERQRLHADALAERQHDRNEQRQHDHLLRAGARSGWQSRPPAARRRCCRAATESDRGTQTTAIAARCRARRSTERCRRRSASPGRSLRR